VAQPRRHRLGKDFIGGGHGIATDTDKLMYTKAAFLLK
jgi:hypothetical protein